MKQAGFSIMELMAVLSLYSILFALAAPSLTELYDDSEAATYQMLVYLKSIKSSARANTTTYLVAPISATQVRVTEADSCTDTTRTNVTQFEYDLPGSATVTTGWSTCFDQMGLADLVTSFTITDTDGSNTIEVLLGGAVRET